MREHSRWDTCAAHGQQLGAVAVRVTDSTTAAARMPLAWETWAWRHGGGTNPVPVACLTPSVVALIPTGVP